MVKKLLLVAIYKLRVGQADEKRRVEVAGYVGSCSCGRVRPAGSVCGVGVGGQVAIRLNRME